MSERTEEVLSGWVEKLHEKRLRRIFLLDKKDYQVVQGLGIIEKQTVVDHVLIVGSQLGKSTVVKDEAEPAGCGNR